MLAAACLIGTVLLTSGLVAWPALAVYALSFWHYVFYWWAYRHGAVAPARFRRDAVLMKSVALIALASVYLTQRWHWTSAIAIGCGFMLNLAGARALGSTRTYYGSELGEVAPQRVTTFPYSVVPHPMLLGNIVAFGGTLLHPGFRRAWWPLAVLHVALNGALIVMETSIAPKPRPQTSQTAAVEPPTQRGGSRHVTRRLAACVMTICVVMVVAAALTADGAAMLAGPAGWAPIAVVAGASVAYGYTQRGLYVPAASPASPASSASAASSDPPRSHARSQEVV